VTWREHPGPCEAPPGACLVTRTVVHNLEGSLCSVTPHRPLRWAGIGGSEGGVSACRSVLQPLHFVQCGLLINICIQFLVLSRVGINPPPQVGSYPSLSVSFCN